MASGPIVLRQIDGETMETVTDFTFLGSKITVDTASTKFKKMLLGYNEDPQGPAGTPDR